MKLSDLLESAMKDLKSAEDDPTCTISMTGWYKGNADRTIVSLGGAVMKAQIEGSMNKDIFELDEYKELIAIDYASRGLLRLACKTIELEPKLPNMSITPYLRSKEGFKADMVCLISLLRREEL